MKLTLIRSATLRVHLAGHILLIDPQLDPAGAREAVPNTPNPRRSPLTDLPQPAETVVSGLDAVLVTHLHRDHFDDTARALLAHDLPLFCQPQDTERLHADGFTDVRPVHGDATLGDLLIARTDGHHGVGDIGRAMAPVSGFVLAAPGEPTLYIAGDTILCDDIVALAREAPDAEIVAVHFECVSHSTETRADLRERLKHEGLTNVSVPEDGGVY